MTEEEKNLRTDLQLQFYSARYPVLGQKPTAIMAELESFLLRIDPVAQTEQTEMSKDGDGLFASRVTISDRAFEVAGISRAEYEQLRLDLLGRIETKESLADANDIMAAHERIPSVA